MNLFNTVVDHDIVPVALVYFAQQSCLKLDQRSLEVRRLYFAGNGLILDSRYPKGAPK